MSSKHGKRYSPEFKREAVLYYRSSGKSYKQVAEELDVSDASLCKWNQEMTEKENSSSDSLNQSEREELARLRRENKRLKMETEIINGWLRVGKINTNPKGCSYSRLWSSSFGIKTDEISVY